MFSAKVLLLDINTISCEPTRGPLVRKANTRTSRPMLSPNASPSRSARENSPPSRKSSMKATPGRKRSAKSSRYPRSNLG